MTRQGWTGDTTSAHMRGSGSNHGNGLKPSASPAELDTKFLIIGCGPAGASLACFLASYGFKGIMVGAAPGTANTPRAHITNMAAIECLRDIGLEREIDRLASKGDNMIHTRWCHSMAGEEFARVYSWGNDPRRKGDYEQASPCNPVDLPQTLLEPVLIRYATNNGFKVRFDTKLLHFKEDADSKVITATLRDGLTGREYDIRTKYLFGADGAQSQVVKQLDLPMDRQQGQGMAINILVKTDLSHLIDPRKGNLHWIMQPDREHPSFGWAGIVRMVKPWDEWMFILLPDRDADLSIEPTTEEYQARIREFIGDDTPAEILNVSRWYINEIVAETYSKDNIFCLGDAVHRHPPMNGLGSNTCIQDSFNLAWKIAYVEAGKAKPELLSTYSAERQPVGKSVVTRANQAFRDHAEVWKALGTALPDLASRQKTLEQLLDPGQKGIRRRQDLREAIKGTMQEFHGLGVEMGQRYAGHGIFSIDEPEPFKVTGKAAENPVLYYNPNTYPGSRLPHVWLNKSVPTKPVSTIDVAGHGKFVLFTGIGGDAWKVAAENVSRRLGVDIDAYSIGFRQDWEDFYFEWERLRGVKESGAVLVRPDRFVGWRADEVLYSDEACIEKLSHVMKWILGFDGTSGEF